MILFIGFIITICTCSENKDLFYKKMAQNQNTPVVVKAALSLFEEGYKFGHKRYNSLSFLSSSKRVKGSEYYLTDYNYHGAVESAKINMKRNHQNKPPVNEELLGATKSIKTVLIYKHFGKTFSYDYLDIQIEEWSFANSEDAALAYREMLRINKYGFGVKCARFYQRSNRVYFFNMSRPATRCKEFDRIFNIAKVKLLKITF